MTLSPSGIPLVSPEQAGKEETVNDAILQIEALALFPVLSRTPTAPPTSPAPQDGDLYIIPAGASGAWAGKTGRFAHWINGGWSFYDPVDAQKIWSKADGAFLVYSETGNTWSIVSGTGDMNRATYDSDDDGKVNASEEADSIAGTPANNTVYGQQSGNKGFFGALSFLLTGYTSWTDTARAIAATDSILDALQLIQRQISDAGNRLLPAGGTAGQVLKKSTNSDYAVGWGDDNAGTSGSPVFTGLADTFSSFTGRTSQFLRVNSAGTAIDSIALGTAAALDTGTTAGKVVVLDGSGRLPAVDGSQLTNLPRGGGGGNSLYNGLVHFFPFDQTASSVLSYESFGLTTSVSQYNSSPKFGRRCLLNPSGGSGYSLDSSWWRIFNFEIDFTVSFWYYPTAITTGGSIGQFFAIDSFLDGSIQTMFAIVGGGRNGALSPTTTAPYISVIGQANLNSQTVSLNNWHLFVVRYDATTRATTFTVNDQSYTNTIAASYGVDNNRSAARIFLFGGAAGIISNYNHSDRIDQLCWWYRHLTDTEVTSLYNSGNGVNL